MITYGEKLVRRPHPDYHVLGGLDVDCSSRLMKMIVEGSGDRSIIIA